MALKWSLFTLGTRAYTTGSQPSFLARTLDAVDVAMHFAELGLTGKYRVDAAFDAASGVYVDSQGRRVRFHAAWAIDADTPYDHEGTNGRTVVIDLDTMRYTCFICRCICLHFALGSSAAFRRAPAT